METKMEAKCLWCESSIEITDGDKHEMRGYKASRGMKGWYWNGLGYDPFTKQTSIEFFLCPDHIDDNSVRKAFRWAQRMLITRERVGEP